MYRSSVKKPFTPWLKASVMPKSALTMRSLRALHAAAVLVEEMKGSSSAIQTMRCHFRQMHPK